MSDLPHYPLGRKKKTKVKRKKCLLLPLAWPSHPWLGLLDSWVPWNIHLSRQLCTDRKAFELNWTVFWKLKKRKKEKLNVGTFRYFWILDSLLLKCCCNVCVWAYSPINLWALLHLSTAVGKSEWPNLKAAAAKASMTFGFTFGSYPSQ